MKKKCIAIAKKAMVWTLAATMLVATPLTASAAGLRGVYKVEDGWGNTLHDEGEDDTRTGTVSATGSKSGVLNNEEKILGIALDKTDVKMEMEGSYNPENQVTETLEAKIIFADSVEQSDRDKITEELKSAFTWTSSDRDVVTVTVQKDGKADNFTDTVTLSAKAGGNATVTVSLDRDWKGEDIHFKATADVFVKQYADEVTFNTAIANQNVGWSLDISEAFIKSPDTANEDIVYDIESQEPSGVAVLKKDVLTFKKEGKVTVIAVTEKGDKRSGTIEVKAGNPATKVEFKKVGETAKSKKFGLFANNDKQIQIKAELTAKKKDEDCTDKVVSWTPKKDGIVTVTNDGNNQATLKPLKVGSTQITAVTTNGKKGTFTINVTATLTGIKITTSSQTLWSGQTLGMKADLYYKGDAGELKNIGNDKLKWSIKNNNDVKKYAKINGTSGLLTIQSTVDPEQKIEVTVQSAKKIKNGAENDYVYAADNIEISMMQTDIDKIIVWENGDPAEETALATAGYPGKAKAGTVKIAVGKDKIYNAIAYKTVNGKDVATRNVDGEEIALADTLNWSTAKQTIADVIKTGTTGKVSAVNKGKTKITVSGVKGTEKNGKTTYKALKATFTVDVTKPTSTITLSTKTKAVKAAANAKDRKAQTVTYKATLEKNTTSKAKDIVWTIEQKNANGESKTCVASIKNGKVSIPKQSEGYAAGDTFVITATLKDAADKSSVTATATIKVVAESKNIAICGKNEEDAWATFKSNKTPLVAGSDVIIRPQITVDGVEGIVVPGTTDATEVKAADVDLTVNKAGIVQISKAADGTYKVYGIKKGSVKITATTTDGKKATLTVNVSNPPTN